jgi:hypothetical protein
MNFQRWLELSLTAEIAENAERKTDLLSGIQTGISGSFNRFFR